MAKKQKIDNDAISLDMLTAPTQDQGLLNFADLLESLEGIDDKKKSLWFEIYANAVHDRDAAIDLFNSLVTAIKDAEQSPGYVVQQHALNGQTLAKYLDKMHKATDQIIKLAELVQSAENHIANSLNGEDILNIVDQERSK